MAVKKIPMRLCAGCREQHPKRDMIRIVRSPEGDFSIDMTGKKSGRGAYICKNKECFEKAKKEHGFERSFGHKIDSRIYDVLSEELFGGE